MFKEAYTKGGLDELHFKSALLATTVLVLARQSEEAAQDLSLKLYLSAKAARDMAPNTPDDTEDFKETMQFIFKK